MTRNSKAKIIALFLTVALILGISVIGAAAADENKAAHSQPEAQYTNPETGFQVMISDDIDLLTASEEQKLVEDMKPLTEYGHIIFWTTDRSTSDYIDLARTTRKGLYEFDSAGIFMINMNVRKIAIQSYGTIYKYVNDSKARSITDNVSHYATSKNYYTCAKEAFEQMDATLKGEKISEPMKYISFAVIALMIGVIVALSIAFSKKFNPLRKTAEAQEAVGDGVIVAGIPNMIYTKTDTIHISNSGGGGFGGGGGCGGGGCGGGGGGCGGGGGSSF